MFKQYFESIDGISIWPIISLTIFILFFMGVTWWFFSADKTRLEEIAKLPLADDSIQDPKTTDHESI